MVGTKMWYGYFLSRIGSGLQLLIAYFAKIAACMFTEKVLFSVLYKRPYAFKTFL